MPARQIIATTLVLLSATPVMAQFRSTPVIPYTPPVYAPPMIVVPPPPPPSHIETLHVHPHVQHQCSYLDCHPDYSCTPGNFCRDICVNKLRPCD